MEMKREKGEEIGDGGKKRKKEGKLDRTGGSKRRERDWGRCGSHGANIHGRSR